MVTGHVIEQRTYECSTGTAWVLHTVLSGLSDGSYELEVNLEHGGEHYHKGATFLVEGEHVALNARVMEDEMLTNHGIEMPKLR